MNLIHELERALIKLTEALLSPALARDMGMIGHRRKDRLPDAQGSRGKKKSKCQMKKK